MLCFTGIHTNFLRFGNYIGDAESEEEQDVQPQAFKFDEAFDDEEEEVNDQQLMEVDGMAAPLCPDLPLR